MLLLTACNVTSNACPPLKEYSQEYKDLLAAEVRGIPEMFTHIPRTLDDYRILRDQVRACR